VEFDLSSWSAEDISLVKEGYVLIYDSNTGERIGTFNRLVPSVLFRGD